jgi:predicted RNase H-like HicB family nuclease
VGSLKHYQHRALRRARTKRLPADEGYAARIPGFPGLIVFGDTEHAARKELATALEGWIEISLQQGRGLPALATKRIGALSVR